MQLLALNNTNYILWPLLGYLLGAIPFGFIIGKAHGIDIRTRGSGNIGSTNVGRILGRKWGYLCFILDVMKGFIPVWLAGHLLRQTHNITTVTINTSNAIMGNTSVAPQTTEQLLWIAVAASCILGHMFSIYLRFKGGKGVATSLGALLGIWPYFTLTAAIALCIWVAVWGIWRYVSLASIVAALSFPAMFAILAYRINGWVFSQLIVLFLFSCVMAMLVVIRHRSNISRLIAGTEPRGGKTHRHKT